MDYLSTASLQCTAVGHPSVRIVWTGPNGVIPPTSQSNYSYPETLASTLNVTIGQEAEGGGEYKCTAENVEAAKESSVALLSGWACENSNISIFLFWFVLQFRQKSFHLHSQL